MYHTQLAVVALAPIVAAGLAVADAMPLDHDFQTRAPWHASETEASLLATRSDLIGRGYSGIMPVAGDPYRLLALDRWGSEVAIRIDPATGEVDAIHLVHPADR